VKRFRWLAPVVALGMIGLSVSAATAGLLPTKVSIYQEGPNNFRWQYAIVLPSDSQLKAGDYFTIYDFEGLIAGSQTAPDGNWVASAQKIGPTPAKTLPQDDPGVMNLSWMYSGETISVGQTGLGNFMANSLYENREYSLFTSSTHRASDGRPSSNITPVDVPVPSSNAVPEPATLLIGLLGLPLLSLARSRRKPTAG